MNPVIAIWNRIPEFVPRKQRIHVFAMVLAVSIAVAMPAQADYEKGVQAWESGQYQEALTEWMSAANADDSRAMLAIGRAYLQGLGVLQDYVEAHKWFNLAASRGVQEALKERDSLSAEMTKDERAEARALAHQWRPDGSAAVPSVSVVDTVTAAPPPEAIREAQALLRALGYRPGPADGLWGQRTGAAYKSFLQDKGMPTSEMLSLVVLLAMRDIAKAQGVDEISLRAAMTPEALHQAAKAGDVTTLKAALDAGADVNRLDGKGWTALIHAVNKGNLLIVEPLIKAGADVDIRAPDGATALFMAAVLEQPETVERLMKANADFSIPGPKGKTAVDMAWLAFGEPSTVRNRGMNKGVLGLVKGKTLKEINEEIPLPASFEKCENTPRSQRPKPVIAPLLYPRDRMKFSKKNIKLKMKRSAGKPVQELLKWESISWPGPNGKSILRLKQKWYYKPPVGSSTVTNEFDAMSRRGDKTLDTVVDTVGKHIIALRVEDESGACAAKAYYFTVY